MYEAPTTYNGEYTITVTKISFKKLQNVLYYLVHLCYKELTFPLHRVIYLPSAIFQIFLTYTKIL